MKSTFVYSNRIIAEREAVAAQERHRQKRDAIRAGKAGYKGGIDMSAPKVRSHIVRNPKRRQAEAEKIARIEADNHRLLKKIIAINERKVDDSNGELRPGYRLDKHHVPVLDAHVSPRSNAPGAAVPKGSLNYKRRKDELQRIEVENMKFLDRLVRVKPNLSSKALAKEAKRQEGFRRNIAGSRAVPQEQEPVQEAYGQEERSGSVDGGAADLAGPREEAAGPNHEAEAAAVAEEEKGDGEPAARGGTLGDLDDVKYEDDEDGDDDEPASAPAAPAASANAEAAADDDEYGDDDFETSLAQTQTAPAANDEDEASAWDDGDAQAAEAPAPAATGGAADEGSAWDDAGGDEDEYGDDDFEKTGTLGQTGKADATAGGDAAEDDYGDDDFS